MSHYLHHVPGRLRLKARSLKNSEDKAAEIRALCMQLPGIQAIELNTLTGSLLVRYEKASVNSTQILGFLFTNGVITSIPEARPTVASKLFDGSLRERATDSMAEAVAKFLANLVVDKVLPRAAMALVSAVI
jgi:Heavy metal associated domain 2